jgi:hypothetical protein
MKYFILQVSKDGFQIKFLENGQTFPEFVKENPLKEGEFYLVSEGFYSDSLIAK